MSTSKARIKAMDIVWIAVLVILIAIFNMQATLSQHWTCMEQALELVEFYKVFLWPEVATALGISMAVILGVMLGIWVFYIFDPDTDVWGKNTYLVRNMMYMVTLIVVVAYMVLSVICLRAYSLWFLLYGAVIVFAIVSLCINKRAYGKSDNSIEDKEEEKEIDDRAWRQLSTKLNIVLVTGILCGFFFCIDYQEGHKEATFWYTEINAERIDLCYEHVIRAETNLAIVQVEFVNLFGESGRQYTVEELDREYINYMNGTGSWSNLWQFCQDSIAIELDNQRYIENYDPWCYGCYNGTGYDSEMVIYEFGEKPRDKDTDEEKLEYSTKVDDKYRDLIYFGTCVEDKLIEDGLTLSQRGDRFSLDRSDYISEYGELGVDLLSATNEQVYAACWEVAAEIGNEPVYVDSIDLEINVQEGKTLGEVQITELNGYEIVGVYWKQYAGIGFQGRQDGASKELTVEAGKEYKAVISVKIPVWAYFETDTAINITGLKYGKLELSDDTVRDSNVWKVEVSFRVE